MYTVILVKAGTTADFWPDSKNATKLETTTNPNHAKVWKTRSAAERWLARYEAVHATTDSAVVEVAEDGYIGWAE